MAMVLPKCRMCRHRPANSAEHIVPSALGGKRKVHGVICKKCNSASGTKIDAGLIASYQVPRALLGIEGDRGQSTTVRAEAPDGSRRKLGAALQVTPAPAKPYVVFDGGSTRRMRFTSVSEAKDYVDAMVRKNPDKEIRVSNIELHRMFDKVVSIDIVVDNDDIFRSSTKSVLTLLTERCHGLRMPEVWDYVSGACGPIDLQVGWTAAPIAWRPNGLGEFSHIIALKSDSVERRVHAQVSWFGGPIIVVSMGVDAIDDWQYAYAIDPVTGEDLVATNGIGNLGTPVVEGGLEVFRERSREFLERVVDYAGKQGVAATNAKIVAEAFRSGIAENDHGGVFTEQLLANISKRIAEDVVRHHFQINSTVPAPELEQVIIPKKSTPKA